MASPPFLFCCSPLSRSRYGQLAAIRSHPSGQEDVSGWCIYVDGWMDEWILITRMCMKGHSEYISHLLFSLWRFRAITSPYDNGVFKEGGGGHLCISQYFSLPICR